MRLFADESVDGPVVTRLRSDGHDVAYVQEQPPGIADPEVLESAAREGAVLITADKDFGDLVYRLRLPHAGVLLLRLSGLKVSEKCDLVSRALAGRGGELQNAFSVLSGDEVLRVRPRIAT